MVFYGFPRLSKRLPGETPDGKPLYQVADDVPSLREMLRVDQDWKLESFQNHVHFFDPDGDEACLRSQFRHADESASILLERFPTRRFVVVIWPLSQNSIYQASEGAPTEDDEEWEPNGPLSGVVLQQRLQAPGVDREQAFAEVFAAYRGRNCSGCKTRWEYEADYLRDEFPGTRWTDCPNCGRPEVVATRTLRRLVSNDGVE